MNPTRPQLEAAIHRRVPDVIAPHLRILFCGINPGLHSALAGHHFAGPNNRFWPTLQRAGFTSVILKPSEESSLLDLGLGITNLVARTTPKAGLLRRAEFRAGARRLVPKVRRYRPRILAVLGLGAYRVAFADPAAHCGLQPRTIGQTLIWLLPNPSGLNAHHPDGELTRLFRALHTFERSLRKDEH